MDLETSAIMQQQRLENLGQNPGVLSVTTYSAGENQWPAYALDVGLSSWLDGNKVWIHKKRPASRSCRGRQRGFCQSGRHRSDDRTWYIEKKKKVFLFIEVLLRPEYNTGLIRLLHEI